MSSQQHVTDEFQSRFGEPPTYVVRAPGRVNLIGEHTDYNDGFVLPMAIDRDIWIALRRRADRRIVLHSLDFAEPVDFSLDALAHAEGWVEYVMGSAWIFGEGDFPREGWEGVLAGDVPVGAGLSSSAALELALLKAFWAVSPWAWDGTLMAQLARRIENEWVGVQTGVMDQMISSLGVAGHALLIDCRSLEATPVPLPAGTRVVVLDTGTRRGLVDSAYNERVAQCREAAAYFDVPALRDVSLAALEAGKDGLDRLPFLRARHVVSENERTLHAVDAMRAGDPAALGRLINASHRSLRDDYEVSSKELDLMVEIALGQAGCYGARMTGGGFGGCAMALVEEGAVERFVEAVGTGYEDQTGITPSVYVCRASAGVEVLSDTLPE
ncbi:MAG: galactokinase [Chloroflexota bacterium]